MIALDTNVLVRFLARDDPAQAALADRIFGRLTGASPGFVGREVLVELGWVLERAYRLPRPAIAAALEGLLAAREIEGEAGEDLASALDGYRTGGHGLADLMIAAAGRRAGATKLVTFDPRTARIAGVELLQG
jgi:predicted nucleic-acid-binding protein